MAELFLRGPILSFTITTKGSIKHCIYLRASGQISDMEATKTSVLFRGTVFYSLETNFFIFSKKY